MAELGKEWSKKSTVSGVQGSMKVMLLNPAAANANDKNVLATLDEVKNYIILNTPPAPSGAEWVVKPSASLGGNVVTITAGEATFDGVTVSYAGRTETVGLPLSGFIRQDAIAAMPDGTYVYRYGELGTSAITPSIPSNALFVAYLLFTSSGGQVQKPVDPDFAAYDVTSTPADADILAIQKVDKTKRKFSFASLVTYLKRWFDGSFKPFDAFRDYAIGDKFRGAGAVYEVVTAWPAMTYVSDWQIPSASLKLVSNLDTPGNVINVSGTIATTGSGFVSTLSNVTFVLAPDAAAGQAVAIYTNGQTLAGKTAKVRIVWNGITNVTADPQFILGDGGVPNGAVAGDVIVWELQAHTAGKFTIVQKYVEGKTLATGGGTSATPPTTGEAASTVLNFTNQSGHSRLPLTTSTALNFTLGAGPHKPFSVVRQPVIATAEIAVAFSSDFDTDFLYIGLSETDTLPAGRYEFLFSYNEDGKVSVSVPGSGDYEAGGAVDWQDVQNKPLINNTAPDANGNYTIATGTGGTTISSTDQLAEGTTNLYFTEARAYLAKAVGYLKQGTTRAIAATDSLMMILGILENRIDANTTAITANTTKLNKFGEDAGANPTYSGLKILRQGDAPAIGSTELAAMNVGQSNLITVEKQIDGSPKYRATIEQIDKLAAITLATSLADSAPWVGFRIELTGDNIDGQLGYNSQELHSGRRGYDCISSTDTSAVWLRTTKVDSLDPANPYDASIIAQLENETGWHQNIKQVTVKSVKGDEYTDENSGYLYVCFSDDNKWRRVSEPATDIMYLQKVGAYTNLCNALEVHDFAVAAYDAAVLATSDEKGSEGQRYYASATRSLFECVKSANGKIIWEKIR